ncbi:putative hydrolase, alpha/beta fold LipV [Sphingobium jiangsuense]|nr:alpha/beta fold hydrolase [Sphingobium jiangsuense]GLS98910.1 putative hydrolase, alpha/beta fold LipV [Sphingobium jiangsuense]
MNGGHVTQNIHITRWGSAGPRVVLVHGGTQGTSAAGHANFRAQEALAAQGWQIIVPDRPGHGASPAPGRPDDAEADGPWVADLLEDGAHLVGHSFGGLVALAATARRPEAVRSLVLIEPALLKMAAGKPAVRKVLLRMAAAFILPWSNATRARKVMDLLGIPDEFALTKADLSSLGASLKQCRLPSKALMTGWLESVRKAGIPLLVISSGSNAAFMETDELAAEVGGGTHAICPAPNHFPQWNEEMFNAMVGDFWTAAEARIPPRAA